MGLSNIDIEPIDAVLIALDPLDREPIIIKPISNIEYIHVQNQFQLDYCAIMSLSLLTRA